MNIKSLHKKIKVVLKKTFKISENKISIKSSNKTIPNWDSISHLNLIIEIEKQFKIKIKPEEAYKLDSFESILKFLKRK